ncbi:hypothetical protein J4433_00710 [Candidatus Pacearchaeota archaeon]|nr:hypothetical protein [Candidatus Pacearchaeota archaeon]
MRLVYLSILAIIIVTAAAFFLVPFKNPFVVKNSKEMPFGSSQEKASPSNYINASQIEIQDSRIIITIDNASMGRFANTSSMMPLIDEDSNSIRIVPSSPEQIHVGDIITFEQDNILIVHRVIETGYDSNGWYATTKGDNTEQNDGKIRFEQIKYITIGILY